MDTDNIFQAIQESVEEAFGMLGAEVQVKSLDEGDAGAKAHSTIASIGLGGDTTEAAINLLFPKSSAGHIISLMMGEEADDPDVVNDGMGEVANLVAGGVKARMHQFGVDLTLGLPSVITGENIRCAFSNTATVHPFLFIVDGEHEVDGRFLVRDISKKKTLMKIESGETA